MDMKLIRQDWETLAGKRMQFAHGFYERLFTSYPQYRAMFPEGMDTQMERMVEMFSGIARFADHTDLIRPYLTSVGYAHRRLGIGAEDVENFKNVFIATLAHLCAEWWTEAHDTAWRDVFDDMILPMFDEGLETGRRSAPG